jgi:hypothetical protein
MTAIGKCRRQARRQERPEETAGSTGRRNTLVKSLGWGLEVQRFPGALVEPARHLIEMGLRVRRQVRPARKVLAQQPVGVFVRAALPRALRVTKIDVDVSFHRESLVVCEFFSAVPGQRFVEFVWEFACCDADGAVRPFKVGCRERTDANYSSGRFAASAPPQFRGRCPTKHRRYRQLHRQSPIPCGLHYAASVSSSRAS